MSGQSTFLSAERPVRVSPSPDCARGFATIAATWPSNSLGWLHEHAPGGWFGKMCPASCHREADGILAPSSGRWSNAGMGSPTGCLTLSISEFHSAAAASSLLAILETGALPPRFFLSAKACIGILRRAAGRSKTLPAHLAHALQAG